MTARTVRSLHVEHQALTELELFDLVRRMRPPVYWQDDHGWLAYQGRGILERGNWERGQWQAHRREELPR